MKIDRTKNASRNMIFGILLRIYQLLVPFFTRTCMIYCMGVEYLGLNSIYASILSVLNLAELGVGSAMVFSMYKPIAEDDTAMICALMKMYRTYYRIIGILIALLGLCLTPFIPKFVKNGLPVGLNLYILYLLNLASTVLSYWLFAYKTSLFTAHQRNDIPNKIQMVTSTLQFLLQIFIIVFIKNYYVYTISIIVVQILTNIISAIVADRMYPKYHPIGKLSSETIKSINCRIRDLFTSRIGSVVVNQVDTVVISAFLGLTVLAIYQNYYFILASIIGVITVIFSSCTAGIGNSFVVDTKEKIYGDFKKFTFIISWISGFCTCCFACLYQPFVKLWLGEALMLDYFTVIIMCIYFYIFEINQLLNLYKDAAGMWHEDRFRPLVTAMSNLGMNLIMVHIIGLDGVVLSTVLSMLFIGMPWLLHNLFTVLFEKNQLKSYLKSIVTYAFETSLACSLCILVCHFVTIEGVFCIIVRGIICCIVPNSIFYLFNKNKSEFSKSVELFDYITKGKLHSVLIKIVCVK